MALALYYAVRDDIRYDPYSSSMQREAMRASTTVIKGASYCVPKAILYCACLRAVGIPARPGFADVKNHLSTEKLTRLMGTDVFAWHGYVSLLLDGYWVKATPAFNLELCQKAGVKPLEFDGAVDSIFHEFDAHGRRHMEYIRDRGTFADVPRREMLATFAQTYPAFESWMRNAGDGNFEQEVSSGAAT